MSEVLVIYGITPDYKKWLSKKKHLVFIEDDLEKWQWGKAHITDPKIEIHFWENPFAIEPLLKKIAWKFLFLPTEIKAAPEYKNREQYKQITYLFQELEQGIQVVVADYSDFGTKLFANLYQNLLQTNEVRFVKDLRLPGIPAIICGAGPSLQKNGHLLKEMQDKALIFAGGSAINVLNQLGVEPSFAGAIDKEAPYDQAKMQSIFATPFFYQNRVYHKNLSLVQGERLLAGDSGGYPLEKWLIQEVDLDSATFDGGWNVGNFLTQIALHLGCNPIFFVGMDLCFQKGKSYAEGVGLKQKGTEGLVTAKSFEGKEVLTQKDWLLGAKWTAELGKHYPGRFFNCTEGGLGFGAIPNIPLKEAPLKETYDLKGLVHQAIQKAKSHVLDREKVQKAIGEIEESLQACERYCDQALQTGAYDEALFDELFYTELLVPLWQIFKPIFLRELASTTPEQILLNEILFFKQVIAEHKGIL